MHVLLYLLCSIIARLSNHYQGSLTCIIVWVKSDNVRVHTIQLLAYKTKQCIYYLWRINYNISCIL